MFNLSDLKQTKVYQEALDEGKLQAKLESIPRLLALGLTPEQIANRLDISLETVNSVINN